MRIVTAALVGLASGIVPSTASLAQMVVPLEGKLSMNGGIGFHDVAGPVNGKVGGFVMAGARSSGQIIYGDGCQVRVVPGRVVAITAVSPCASALGQTPPSRLAAEQPVEPLTPIPPPPPPPAPRPPTPVSP